MAEARKRRRKRGIGIRLLGLAVFIFGFITAMYILITNMVAPALTTGVIRLEQPAENPENPSSSEPSRLTGIAVQAPNVSLMPVYTGDITDTGYLALINRQHPISSEPDFDLLVSAWPAVPVRTTYGMYLHSSALQAIELMFASAIRADIGSFFVSSGFRSYDDQRQLYNGGVNSAFVLPSGHSEHHTGLAADILAVGIYMSEMGNSKEGHWLANNSYRYGLILRYPEGAETITGIEFEPWHFRYVGRDHAYFMRQNNLVLEEYIGLIQSLGSFSFEKGGITYYILHQIPQNDMINLPDGLNFTISNDNLGGYIVAAWR